MIKAEREAAGPEVSEAKRHFEEVGTWAWLFRV